MKAAALLVLTYCAVSALSVDGNIKRSKPSATVVPAMEFSPSTPAPTNKTTPAPTNTTTPSPTNTTTPAPTNTTTPAPTNTTTPAPTNTTTPAPTNTTTPAPTNTTTPVPTPSTNVTVGKYSIKMDNKTCLMAQMALQIRLGKAGITFKVQPDKTRAEGGCNKTTANLTLAFQEGFITFMFIQSTDDDAVYVNQLSFNISYNLNSFRGNGEFAANNASVRLFRARVGRSYSCRNESIFMGSDLYLDVSQDRMQAFKIPANNEFGPSDICDADKPDYSVAIGVGVALLVLIVIVVVVYCVSRKSRTDGYQSL